MEAAASDQVAVKTEDVDTDIEEGEEAADSKQFAKVKEEKSSSSSKCSVVHRVYVYFFHYYEY